MSIYKRYKGKRLKKGDPDWGKGTWWMEFHLRGHQVHESIPGARTQSQAERAENAIRESIYDGKYNKAAQTCRFREFFEDVYMLWAKTNKASWDQDESRGRALKDFFGNEPLRNITPLRVRKLKTDLLGAETVRHTPRKGTTVNRYLMLLSKIMQMAFEEGLIDSNPVRRVPKEPEGEGRKRFLTYEEEEKLLPQMTGRQAYLYAPVIVGIDAGLRFYSELLKLEVPHCNFGAHSVFFKINGQDIEVKPNRLLVVKSKNRKPRCVPMTERVREVLKEVIQDRTEGLIFASHRTGVSYRAAFR
jgi:integrase